MREIDALVHHETNLASIGHEIESLVQARNREDRLAGVDKDGITLLALKPSTIARRQGTGPPLAEHGTAARVITNLVVTAEADPNRLDIRLAWIGMDWLKWHVRGRPPLAGVRDILGMRPRTIQEIDELVVEESDRQLAERLAAAGKSRLATFFGFFGGGR